MEHDDNEADRVPPRSVESQDLGDRSFWTAACRFLDAVTLLAWSVTVHSGREVRLPGYVMMVR